MKRTTHASVCSLLVHFGFALPAVAQPPTPSWKLLGDVKAEAHCRSTPFRGGDTKRCDAPEQCVDAPLGMFLVETTLRWRNNIDGTKGGSCNERYDLFLPITEGIPIHLPTRLCVSGHVANRGLARPRAEITCRGFVSYSDGSLP